MAGTTEHGKLPAVVRVIELVGVSSEGWSDAARQAVARASQTLRNITALDVVKSSAVVQELPCPPSPQAWGWRAYHLSPSEAADPGRAAGVGWGAGAGSAQAGGR